MVELEQREPRTATAEGHSAKPRLVFFKYRYPRHLPEFLLTHFKEHDRCLSQFFDVTTIAEDCDYEEICDRYQPDLAVFETGLNISTCQKARIRNARAVPQVPKVALFNADAWCETRAATLSEMDEWGIETYFSIAVTAAEHAPEIADRLYIWPNSVDPEIFRDYQEHKLIPVLLTGAKGSQYPWRKAVFDLVAEHYPTLSCPHHGYINRSGTGQAVHGEAYARLINASMFVPACGTVAKELVRKHLEVPACNTCLIAEKSPALEAAGFVDMKNCVFADGNDILDKLGHLLEHPKELQAITRAGYTLVQSRHTQRQRDQLLQWYRLHKTLRNGERIVQTNPFAPLTVVPVERRAGNVHVISHGLHLSMMRRGDEHLWAGEYHAAEECYTKCLQYTRRFPEALFRLVLCDLHTGNAQAADARLRDLQQYTLAERNARDPEPVEWAYYILTALCLGDTRQALERSGQFEWLQHPELDRARRAANLLAGRNENLPPADSVARRATIHQLPARDQREWEMDLCRMLRACSQGAAAERLSKHERPVSRGLGRIGAILPRRNGVSSFKRRLFYDKVRRRVRNLRRRFIG